jgi:rhodanese-related sulfurtransferase
MVLLKSFFFIAVFLYCCSIFRFGTSFRFNNRLVSLRTWGQNSKTVLYGAPKPDPRYVTLMDLSHDNISRIEIRDFWQILKTDQRREYQILDIRENGELKKCKLPGDDILQMVPTLEDTWKQGVVDGITLNKTKPTICFCHEGIKSFLMAHFLGT